MQFRMSAMADGVLVVEVEDKDTGPIVDRLSGQNHGYAIRGIESPVAVIDGRLSKKQWCTPDHLLAIEILEEHGFIGAAQILRGRGVLVE